MTDKKTAAPESSQKERDLVDGSSTSAMLQQHRPPIFEIQKSASERIRIGIRDYRGRTYVDVRVWYVAEGGEYKPSGKGVTIRPAQVTALIQGLSLAARAIDPQGGA